MCSSADTPAATSCWYRAMAGGAQHLSTDPATMKAGGAFCTALAGEPSGPG
jgi:hypothetical protein